MALRVWCAVVLRLAPVCLSCVPCPRHVLMQAPSAAELSKSDTPRRLKEMMAAKKGQLKRRAEGSCAMRFPRLCPSLSYPWYALLFFFVCLFVDTPTRDHDEARKKTRAEKEALVVQTVRSAFSVEGTVLTCCLCCVRVPLQPKLAPGESLRTYSARVDEAMRDSLMTKMSKGSKRRAKRLM